MEQMEQKWNKMEQKVELRKKLPDLIDDIDSGKVKQVDLQRKYGVPKGTLSRWISEERKKKKKNIPKVEQKVEQNGTNGTKVEQKKPKSKPQPGSGGGRKSDLQKQKELIDHKYRSKHLAEYRVIKELAEKYKSHFNNKTIRVTNRLKDYINKPEGMIRMSLIMGE